MIALFLLLQAAAPAAPPLPTAQVCRRAPGSDAGVCSRRAQQGPYRLQKLPPKTYGPAAPSAQSLLGKGVKVRGQASNRGRAGRNRSMATVGIPF